MDLLIKKVDVSYGDLKDSMAMYKQLQKETNKQEAYEYIIFKSIKLIIDLLFLIISRQHEEEKP